MKRLYLLIPIVFTIFSNACDNGDDAEIEENTITISGNFEKKVQGINIFDTDINGEIVEKMPYITFIPQNIDGNEKMNATPDDEGRFFVELPKGETYNCLIMLKTGQTGILKFSLIDGNEFTVPANAIGEHDLGKLYVTYIGAWVAENPLPWLSSGIIDVKNNTPPVISDIGKDVFENYDSNNNYLGSIITLTANSPDMDIASCIWILFDTDGHASLSDNGDVFRIYGRGKNAYVYTDLLGGHGNLSLIMIDSEGGSAKKTIEF